MTTASFSVNRDGDQIDTLATGVQKVTEGVLAPGVGDLEIRVNISAGWTKNELENAFDTISRYFFNAENSQSIPL